MRIVSATRLPAADRIWKITIVPYILNQLLSVAIILYWLFIACMTYFAIIFRAGEALELLPNTYTIVRGFIISICINLFLEVLFAYADSKCDSLNTLDRAWDEFTVGLLCAARNVFGVATGLVVLTIIIETYQVLFMPKFPGELLGDKALLMGQTVFVGMIIVAIFAFFRLFYEAARPKRTTE